MLPIVALVGRPNVGKSTLFNRLTGTRDALVDDQPGVTRDRLYGRCTFPDAVCLVVDTGGLTVAETAKSTHPGEHLTARIDAQVKQVIADADAILFLVDYHDGLVAQDRTIAMLLRRSGKAVHLLVNKSEGLDGGVAVAEFQQLGLGLPHAISARRGDHVRNTLHRILADHPPALPPLPSGEEVPRIAMVGRPNVGKSTLINRLVGESRVLVSDLPGTTRDSVHIPLQCGQQSRLLIDTAGLRRKSKITDTIEKFSVIKTLQAIDDAHVALLVLDSREPINAQDSTIAGLIYDSGKSMVIIANKWDGRSRTAASRQVFCRDLQAQFAFLPKSEIITTSALHGSHVHQIMPAAMRAYESSVVEIATSSLNRTLSDAITKTPPPMHKRRPIRLKFAHQAGKNPPVVAIHGNLVHFLPTSYRRYLAKFFAQTYRLHGTPVRIALRVSENPYARRRP